MLDSYDFMENLFTLLALLTVLATVFATLAWVADKIAERWPH